MVIRGEPKAHRLYLLRHADAADDLPGVADAHRELTRLGRSQARSVAEVLAGLRIELVLSSTATRAKQTTELLSLPAPVRYVHRLYNAGARQVLSELTGVGDDVGSVLVVGHAPGLPAIAYHLADGAADQAALTSVRPFFPPATLVGLQFNGGWSELSQAEVHLVRPGFPAHPPSADRRR